ncbi:MAG: 50S ribosomal protein L21 [Candidatus Gribaldobacteria bacterium]|nr:50S ribosomal protein L21 [Candidatus Gribaldobacteria bacterium]
MAFAVIKTGGKQYIVEPGKKLKVEKLDLKEGQKEVVFDEVLLLEKDGKMEIGTPRVAGAKVTANILREGKADKIIIFKYKSKKRTRVKKGHRQPYLEVEVSKI